MTGRHPAQARTLKVLLGAQALGSLGTGAGTAMGAVVAYQITDTEALAGVARTVALLATAVFAVPLAALALRRGRRIALSLAWALAALGCVLIVLAVASAQVWLLLVGLFCSGAAQAGGLQSRFAGTDLEVPQRRTRSLSLVVWATTIGVVLGPNLAAPGEHVGRWLHLAPISGVFVIAALAFALTTAVVWLGLRPDPLLTARALEQASPAQSPVRRGGALAIIWAEPTARFALLAVALGHAVMVTVMTMSAVHLNTHGHSLSVIGVMISVHTLGMYAFSPLVGQTADRWGERRVVLAGQGINLVALTCCFFSGSSVLLTSVGLFLLGLGWSAGMVAGSSLLTASVPESARTRAQGTTDTTMSLCAAAGAAVAGPVQASFGFAWLSVVSLVVLLPIVWLGVRVRHRSGRSSQMG